MAPRLTSPRPYAEHYRGRAAIVTGAGPGIGGTRLLGAAVLAATEPVARDCLIRFGAVEVHRWERGGRR